MKEGSLLRKTLVSTKACVKLLLPEEKTFPIKFLSAAQLLDKFVFLLCFIGALAWWAFHLFLIRPDFLKKF